MGSRELARGSVWRQWDLHVHTPASFHWTGQKFEGDLSSDENKKLLDEMIEAMNKAQPAVYAIMDYWTFDGWFALKKRLTEHCAPKLEKTVFPGIELRLSAPTEKRLNAHVIFSDEISDQHLRDFLSSLIIERTGRPLSRDALIDLARNTATDMLQKKGHKKETVDNDDEEALLAGYKLAEIKADSYKEAIAKVPDGLAIGFMPYDTSDGLSEVKWEDHYAYFLGLFESSPIFESRNLELRGAFLCKETEKNEKWIENFKHGLNNIPRLVVSGSDAHCFVGTPGDDNKRGYGDFPSGKKTWIKADPTFLGLKQAILEPEKRSFIGEMPPKLHEVETNKTYYMESVEVSKTGGSADIGKWLDGCDIPLNPDLVAIIGNKGSGKSALADVIATLGNSRQSKHFSFLKRDRFFGKTGEPARHFTGTLTWCDASTEIRELNTLPSEEKAELVRYVPQHYFEELCNEHASGKSDAFEKELRSVIFSHTSEEMRLGALDFDQLTEQQEQSIRNRLSEYRKELSSLNASIVRMEKQLQPVEMEKLEELLLLKTKQIEEHDKLKPEAVEKPAQSPSPEQKQAAEELEEVNRKIEEAEKRAQQINTENAELAKQKQAIESVRERLRLLQRSFEKAEQESESDLNMLGIAWTDLAEIEIRTTVLDKKSAHVSTKRNSLAEEKEKLPEQIEVLIKKKQELSDKLDAPQQQYEAYQRKLVEWEKKRSELIGSPTDPETKEGLEARIAQIKSLPEQLKTLGEKRLKLAGDIFETLGEQRKAREKLFSPVQELIENNSLIREDYRLQFQATLTASADAISDQLFGLIKQTWGDFRGKDEAPSTIRKLFDSYDLDTKEGVLAFIKALNDKISGASKASGSTIGIFNLVKKGQSAEAVYDLIFGLKFLEPRYSLLFQDTRIEQLSPGQRGALLLIFYLLIDTGKTQLFSISLKRIWIMKQCIAYLYPCLQRARKSDRS